MFSRSLRSAEVGVIVVEELEPPQALLLRSRADDHVAMRAFADALQAPLPDPGKARQSPVNLTLWMAPDQWLLLTPSHIMEQASPRLRTATLNGHAAAVDVSDALSYIVLSGTGAEEVLSAGCSVDLASLACDRVIRAPVELADVTLLKIKARHRFLLIIERPIAPYLWSWLVDAALGIAPRS